MEPTGGYEELVLEMLSEKNYKISLVNAAQIRAFARANGILAKTDKQIKLMRKFLLIMGQKFQVVCMYLYHYHSNNSENMFNVVASFYI